jgi:hypothetical protein
VLKKILVDGLAILALLGIAFWLGWSRSPHLPKLDPNYQAVLLDNGQVYYGKLDRIEHEFSELTDVYYIQNQVDPQTKEVKNVLVRRGNEWHAPNRSLINTRHILMIEPVTPASKVAASIAALKAKGQ